MKILVVSQYYFPEPFRITDICEQLVKDGFDVTVLTGLPNYPEGIVPKEYKKKSHRCEIINGVKVIRCYEHGRKKGAFHLFLNYYSFALSGKRRIRHLDDNFDLVFVNQLSPVMMAWPGIKYAFKHKKKIILYCYDLWPASLAAGGVSRKSLLYRIFQRISKKIYQSVDCIAVTSKSFVDYFITNHSICADKIVYLPQYCEDLYSSIQPSAREGDMFNVMFAGNIGKVQSVETILNAANLLKYNNNICFHILGNGSNLQNCKRIANDNNLKNVIFYGRKSIEEMKYYYGLADAMIVTLSSDDLISKTLPGKVQSYMAASKPIIASIDGEAARIIKECQGCFCSKSEDYTSLANDILIASNCSFLDELGRKNRKYYLNHFSREVFFASLESLIRSYKV